MTTRASRKPLPIALGAIAGLFALACGSGPRPGTPLYGNGASGVFDFFTFQCKAEVGTPYPLQVTLALTDGSTTCEGGLPFCILYCDPEPSQSTCSPNAYPVALKPVSASCDDNACDAVYQPNQDPDDTSVNWVITLKAATAHLHIEAQGIDPITGDSKSWDDSLLIDTRASPSWSGCD